MQGFTIIELLIVIIILSLLTLIAIPSYNKYRKFAIRGALIHDLRVCIGEIAGIRQSTENPPPLAEIVANCPKSANTRSIELISESPIILQARSTDEQMNCSYIEERGSIICDSPF